MRCVLAFSVLALLLLVVACDAVGVAAPLGGQCHSRADGSVLKAVEDMNGKQWSVVQYPAGITILGISSDTYCAVPIQARESAFIETGFWEQAYFLHSESKERIDAGVLGSHRGFLDIDSDYEWY